MSKGLSQGAAWTLSIIFSIMLFAGVIALIMSIRPTSDLEDPKMEAGYQNMRSGGSEESETHPPTEGQEIRADDMSSVEPKQKKSQVGPIAVS